MARAAQPSRTSPPVRLTFAQNIWEPKSVRGGDPKYSTGLMFDKTKKEHLDFLRVIYNDLSACLKTAWPDERTRPRTPVMGVARNSPIKDADKYVDESGIPVVEKYPELKGHYIMRIYSKNPPPVVDRGRSEIINKGAIYSGCWAKVAMNAYDYDKPTAGVTVGLNGVQKWADGERLGGGAPPVDKMFDDESGQDDPLNYQQQGGDDPFASGGQQQRDPLGGNQQSDPLGGDDIDVPF